MDDTVYLDLNCQDDYEKISLIGKALSSTIRLEIISLLNKTPKTLSEISKELDLQLSSCSFHLDLLEQAGLISVSYNPKTKKKIKTFSYSEGKVLMLLRKPLNAQKKSFKTSVNIGDYVNAKFSKRCGFASETEQLMDGDNMLTFSPLRHKAQILWSSDACFMEYAFPTVFLKEGEIETVEFSLEICSETMGYNNDFPSDITFSVNGKELCCFLCPGDFGDRYGTYTPLWWYPESTKYGTLVTIRIDESGVSLNGKSVNKKIVLSDLFDNDDRLLFKIEVKKDAEHVGGINLFGEKFGDYNRNIELNVTYK